MAKQEITYKQAVAEIEQILSRIEQEEPDVDELTAQVRRVTELLKICRGKLMKAEKDIAGIFEND
ncbi:MAG: exodeoxyribonuclease VII small subunit [Bacteroidota bacterium]